MQKTTQKSDLKQRSKEKEFARNLFEQMIIRDLLYEQNLLFQISQTADEEITLTELIQRLKNVFFPHLKKIDTDLSDFKQKEIWRKINTNKKEDILQKAIDYATLFFSHIK